MLCWLRYLALALIGLIVDSATIQNADVVEFDDVSAAISRQYVCVITQRQNYDDVGGEVKCWGETGASHNGVYDVPSNLTFVQVVTGTSFGCGLGIDQKVTCWGAYQGMEVDGLYTQISAHTYYACGIRTDESINCWGSSTPFDHPTDEKIRFRMIDCYQHHCCALETDGTPHCFGKVGDAEGTVKHTHLNPPRILVDVDSTVDNEEEEEDGYDEIEEVDESAPKMKFKKVSVADGFSCGITLEKDLKCWGRLKEMNMPLDIVPGPFKYLSAGHNGVCVLYDEMLAEPGEENVSHKMKCLGLAARLVPSRELTEEYDQVVVDRSGICAVTMNSEFKCWSNVKSINEIPEGIIIA